MALHAAEMRAPACDTRQGVLAPALARWAHHLWLCKFPAASCPACAPYRLGQVPGKQIQHASVWKASDWEGREGEYTYTFSDADVAELDAALAYAQAAGKDIKVRGGGQWSWGWSAPAGVTGMQPAGRGREWSRQMLGGLLWTSSVRDVGQPLLLARSTCQP